MVAPDSRALWKWIEQWEYEAQFNDIVSLSRRSFAREPLRVGCWKKRALSANLTGLKEFGGNLKGIGTNTTPTNQKQTLGATIQSGFCTSSCALVNRQNEDRRIFQFFGG